MLLLITKKKTKRLFFSSFCVWFDAVSSAQYGRPQCGNFIVRGRRTFAKSQWAPQGTAACCGVGGRWRYLVAASSTSNCDGRRSTTAQRYHLYLRSGHAQLHPPQRRSAIPTCRILIQPHYRWVRIPHISFMKFKWLLVHKMVQTTGSSFIQAQNT